MNNNNNNIPSKYNNQRLNNNQQIKDQESILIGKEKPKSSVLKERDNSSLKEQQEKFLKEQHNKYLAQRDKLLEKDTVEKKILTNVSNIKSNANMSSNMVEHKPNMIVNQKTQTVVQHQKYNSLSKNPISTKNSNMMQKGIGEQENATNGHYMHSNPSQNNSVVKNLNGGNQSYLSYAQYASLVQTNAFNNTHYRQMSQPYSQNPKKK